MDQRGTEYLVSATKFDDLARAVDRVEQLRISLAASKQFEDVVRQLERAAASVLLRSLTAIESRFIAAVPALAANVSKNVVFRFRGSSLDLSHDLAGAVETVLIHGVRNAIDHGIESVTERERLGKAKQSVLECVTGVSCGWLLLRLADDGRGADPSGIAARAEKLGLVSGEKIASLTNEQKLDLIFLGGFTSRDKADSLGGRGVGLDAVRATVREVGGQAFASSRKDEGFSLSIRAPLTKLGIECREVRFGERVILVEAGKTCDRLESDEVLLRVLKDMLGLSDVTAVFDPRVRYRLLQNLEESTAESAWLRSWRELGDGVVLSASGGAFPALFVDGGHLKRLVQYLAK
jgi:chemotaxis protein histidine kinase CheA